MKETSSNIVNISEIQSLSLQKCGNPPPLDSDKQVSVLEIRPHCYSSFFLSLR